MGVAVVDDQGLAVPLGDLDVRAERLLLGRLALGAGPEVVEARLADALDLGQAGQAVDLREGFVESRVAAGYARAPWRDQPSGSPWTMRGASFGCRATVAWTASYRAAVSAAQREPFRSQPTWTSVVTPTDAALASAWSTVPDCMSRWVWESATATRRGSGSGGAAFFSRSRSRALEEGMPRSYERGMPARSSEPVSSPCGGTGGGGRTGASGGPGAPAAGSRRRRRPPPPRPGPPPGAAAARTAAARPPVPTRPGPRA